MLTLLLMVLMYSILFDVPQITCDGIAGLDLPPVSPLARSLAHTDHTRKRSLSHVDWRRPCDRRLRDTLYQTQLQTLIALDDATASTDTPAFRAALATITHDKSSEIGSAMPVVIYVKVHATMMAMRSPR